MKRFLALLLGLGWSSFVLGAAGGVAPLEARIDIEDRASLQRGAQLYVNYCLGCHSLSYMRYDRVGRDLGLSAEQTAENLLFASDRITEPMNISMSPEKAAKWFGVAPPDLSLIARSRGADWLYSYLVTFYADPDPSRPFGVNNVIFGDVGMPHALQSLQGLQEYIAGDTPSEATNVQPVGLEIRADDIIVRKSATMPDGSHVEILDTLKVTQAGEMEPAIYRGAMRDLVNFLVYVGEPARLERNALGLWVVLFMLFFTLLLRTLYKEYWRDVH
ncbi:MAG: cytochrome c1 [Ectothiorhodospiraceae bacterium AqS1]|nr:cytochrome c1 [Ectothiorhodospiraceae bacterium AqS1]